MTSRFNHVDYPHLNDDEWDALQRLIITVGQPAVEHLLGLGSKEQQKDAARNYLVYEARHAALPQNVPLPASPHPRVQSLKMEISTYKGGENESLPRWFVELETAVFARQITDQQLQIAFAMSKLGGRAKSWAFGKRMADPNCFLDLRDFKHDLEEAFQPPKCEFRQRARFLAIKQGKRDLHDYVQEARYLVASIVQHPIDDATQVSVFLNGLAEGPVRTQMFREYPDELEEAILLALQEDFSRKQAKIDGIYIKKAYKPSSSSGPEPMDLSYAEVAKKPFNQRRKVFDSKSKSTMKCYRCDKQGHLAYECRSSAPLSNTAKKGNDKNRFTRFKSKNGQNQ